LAHAAHAKAALEAIAARAEAIGAWHALAVVCDRRDNPAFALADAHDRICRFCMAADVRQRLLHDAVDRALELCVEPAPIVLAELDLDLHVEPVDRLRASRQRLE